MHLYDSAVLFIEEIEILPERVIKINRKYKKVSKGYTTLWIVLLIFFSCGLSYVWIDHIIYEGTPDYVMLVLQTIGILCCIYSIFFDAICGSFSVGKKGITIYVGLCGYKTYFHPWESIKDCGTAWARTANDGGTYCIYFSTRRLTIAEKQKFLWKTRRDLDNIAYFQYSEETMAEIYPVLPPEIAAKVKENVELVESSMNSFERRHHK